MEAAPGAEKALSETDKLVDSINAALNEKEKHDEDVPDPCAADAAAAELDKIATQMSQMLDEHDREREEAQQEEIYWENDCDELDDEMKAKIDLDNGPSAPFRTDPDAPSIDANGKYIPQVLTEEERADKEYQLAIERLGFVEKPPSKKAWKIFSLYYNLLTEQSSRLAVCYQRGASLKDRKKFTHCFHLIDGNPNEFLESISHLKRGDVWACTVYGDELWHTPMADRNVLRDPKYRARQHEEEAAAKLAFLEKLNKITSPKKSLQLRVTELEVALRGIVEVTKIYQQQQTTISMLMNLRSKDKYNHEMVGYLREQAGIHERTVRNLMEVQNMTLRGHQEILAAVKAINEEPRAAVQSESNVNTI